MYQVLHGEQVLAECNDLQQAAEALLQQSIGAGLRVTAGGEVVIEVAQRYIDGDCYEPLGYEASTTDARIALRCAKAMRVVRSTIDLLAWRAMEQLRGVSFQSPSVAGVVDVRLSWTHALGFKLVIRRVEDGCLVYAPFLDYALSGRCMRERVTPTLGYFIDRAAEFGVELPPDEVELIRSRADLDA